MASASALSMAPSLFVSPRCSIRCMVSGNSACVTLPSPSLSWLMIRSTSSLAPPPPNPPPPNPPPGPPGPPPKPPPGPPRPPMPPPPMPPPPMPPPRPMKAGGQPISSCDNFPSLSWSRVFSASTAPSISSFVSLPSLSLSSASNSGKAGMGKPPPRPNPRPPIPGPPIPGPPIPGPPRPPSAGGPPAGGPPDGCSWAAAAWANRASPITTEPQKDRFNMCCSPAT